MAEINDRGRNFMRTRKGLQRQKTEEGIELTTTGIIKGKPRKWAASGRVAQSLKESKYRGEGYADRFKLKKDWEVVKKISPHHKHRRGEKKKPEEGE